MEVRQGLTSTLYIEPADRAVFVVFLVIAFVIAFFSSRRRRIERELRDERHMLDREVAERTRQANLLNLTHDFIFVRDMSDVITYRNRGAEELYGWTAEHAIGRHADELLRTVFPVPFEEIERSCSGPAAGTASWIRPGPMAHRFPGWTVCRCCSRSSPTTSCA